MIRQLLAVTLYLCLTGCQTNLYVPATDATGKTRSIKVVSISGDAAGIDAGYEGPHGRTWLRADGIVHSEPTRASAEVVTASGRAGGNIIWNYFFGSSVLETAKGASATNIAKEETTRHAATETTTRALSTDSVTKALAP